MSGKTPVLKGKRLTVVMSKVRVFWSCFLLEMGRDCSKPGNKELGEAVL
jgi:hypothetical protein